MYRGFVCTLGKIIDAEDILNGNTDIVLDKNIGKSLIIMQS